jgi:hypothetical protein
MQNTHGASTLRDPNVKLDLAADQGEKELKDITGYQAIVGSLMYAALVTRSDISFPVPVHRRIIFVQSPDISPPPKEFVSISNPPPTIDAFSVARPTMMN